MSLMSASAVLSHSLTCINQTQLRHTVSSLRSSSSSLLQVSCKSRRKCGFIPHAKNNGGNPPRRKRSWLEKLFLGGDDDGNWFGVKDSGIIDDESNEFSDEELSEGEKFEAWKRRAEAIIELREAQEDMLNEEGRRWEDWFVDVNEYKDNSFSSWSQDWDKGMADDSRESVKSDPSDLVPERGLVETVRDLVLGKEEDDILYEDRVFRYASLNSAKFLAVLILVPWAVDFVVHDYILMPFLDRYVKTVPLAAQILDVRRSQKLEMVKELKIEKARYKIESEMGRSPPLSDDEIWWEVRDKALELRDEWRLENRKAFANIWSDMVFGVSLFFILYFNQSKVALLKFTGYKIINNISDTGKAFLIILITDIFLGYHSESGWETLLEIIVDHYGVEVDSSAITIFVCLIPVIIDACVKLWLFRFLPKFSPNVSNIFQEMKRH